MHFDLAVGLRPYEVNEKIISTTTLFLETHITEFKRMKCETLFKFFLRGISTSLDEVVCFSDRNF